MKTSHSRGFENMRVVVESVSEDGTTAMCIDARGMGKQVNAAITRGKGGRPVAGETWMIDREFGNYTFAACVIPLPPEVTGSREGLHPVVASLLDALAAQGLVLDLTTPG